VGGAIIGNRIQKRNDSDVYRVSVRMDNGAVRQYDYSSIDDLRVGDRVRVDDGQLHRV
jgi:outer membrane lipoprotein SlyB